MSEPRAPSPRERLEELSQKLHAFFARAARLHGEAITCRAGCDDCCQRRFSVTLIEAAAIREALASLPEGTRRAIAERAGDPSGRACPALEGDGRCAVYEARPTICRTHGLVLRFPGEGPRSLPVLDACPKNFSGHDIASVDPTTVLDQGTLSTVLGALSAAYADSIGARRDARVEMTALCLEGHGVDAMRAASASGRAAPGR